MQGALRVVPKILDHPSLRKFVITQQFEGSTLFSFGVLFSIHVVIQICSVGDHANVELLRLLHDRDKLNLSVDRVSETNVIVKPHGKSEP